VAEKAQLSTGFSLRGSARAFQHRNLRSAPEQVILEK
jgi:hypothetical protein